MIKLTCLLLLVVGFVSFVGAHSDQENLRYVESIIMRLNNELECDLPTYQEVDELQKVYEELEENYGKAKFDSMLSDDMRLVRRTLLDQWKSFQERMTSTVVIRAAKRRSFMCRVEDYQQAKFQWSVCTHYKEIRSPVTDKIFEKNPIVRYIKHLETKEVIERPDEEENTTEAPERKNDLPQTIGQLAGEDQTPSTTTTTTTTTTSAPDEFVDEQQQAPTTEAPVEVLETTTPIIYKNPSDGLRPGDHYLDDDGVPKIFLAQFTIEKNKDDGSKEKMNFKLNQYIDYDPLTEIPAPKPDDSGEEEPKEEDITTTTTTTTTTTETPTEAAAIEQEASEVVEITEAPTTTTTTTEEPLFDELGAAFVDIEEDDDDLARVVRLPKKDWEFDQVFGYFKWPDEGNDDGEGVYHLDPSVRHMWSDFLTDPYAFDQYLASLVTTTPRPKINGAKARRLKQNFFNSLENEEHRDEKFGWKFETSTKDLVDHMKLPPVNKDRWVKLLNNNVCRVGYNKDEIKRKAKGGYKAVKSWFNKRRSDESEIEFE